jgi:hypothetical protein
MPTAKPIFRNSFSPDLTGNPCEVNLFEHRAAGAGLKLFNQPQKNSPAAARGGSRRVKGKETAAAMRRHHFPLV